MTGRFAPAFLWALFEQLRRRHFPLGSSDYEALRQALRAGFGWSSRDRLRDLCSALWANSKREKEILESLFDQLGGPAWELPTSRSKPIDAHTPAPEVEECDDHLTKLPSAEASDLVPAVAAQGRLPLISIDEVQLSDSHFVFVPQFPLTHREVAQAWRRLREPAREGPPTELDIDATVDRRCRLGVVSDVVLIPRRRNTVQLLLLVDRQGSMTPFHHFVMEVCVAIQQAGNLENVALYYFHDLPVEGADETVLDELPNQLFPTLDPVLSETAPLTEGSLHDDRELTSPVAVEEVLRLYADGAAVVILSDAGAARGRYDLFRLLDTVSFLKALRAHTKNYVWLNPLPRIYWRNSTAAQIARYVPMFPLDRIGMYKAVNVLRGQPYLIERSI